MNWVSFRSDEIRSKSFHVYYDKPAINFLLTELIKIDQLFLYYYRQSLGVPFDWWCLCAGQIIPIVYDRLRFATDHLFKVHSHLSFKRYFWIVSRALRSHVKQYVGGWNHPTGFSGCTKAMLQLCQKQVSISEQPIPK